MQWFNITLLPLAVVAVPYDRSSCCSRPSTHLSPVSFHAVFLAGSGGCFPLHYDNPGPPNKRALTCLLYLNPDWKVGDGGEVCLRPFLGKEKAIAPLLDRLVGGPLRRWSSRGVDNGGSLFFFAKGGRGFTPLFLAVVEVDCGLSLLLLFLSSREDVIHR